MLPPNNLFLLLFNQHQCLQNFFFGISPNLTLDAARQIKVTSTNGFNALKRIDRRHPVLIAFRHINHRDEMSQGTFDAVTGSSDGVSLLKDISLDGPLVIRLIELAD